MTKKPCLSTPTVETLLCVKIWCFLYSHHLLSSSIKCLNFHHRKKIVVFVLRAQYWNYCRNTIKLIPLVPESNKLHINYLSSLSLHFQSTTGNITSYKIRSCLKSLSYFCRTLCYSRSSEFIVRVLLRSRIIFKY